MKLYLLNPNVFVGLMGTAFFLACITSIAHASLVWSGDVNPANPSIWTSSTTAYIGKSSMGTITVNGGSTLLSAVSYVAYDVGSSGVITISGIGSKWTCTYINLGFNGNGTLNIEAGGQVSNWNGHIGDGPTCTGTAKVTGAGSKWILSGDLFVGRQNNGKLTVSDGGEVTTFALYASPSDLLGNGTISTSGAVLDADLVFDAAHGTHQTLAFGTGGNLNLNLEGTGILGAGYRGIGTLAIAEGKTITSTTGYLGYKSGSSGIATVAGTGSTWNITNNLYVGNYGMGNLTVANGGSVTAKTIYASLSSLSGNGTITVKGARLDADLVFDSFHGTHQAIPFGTGGALNLNLDGTSTLGIGYKNSGTLRITDAVAVTVSNGSIGHSTGSSCTATITGVGSKWIINNFLQVWGGGTLNIEAGGQVSNSDGYVESQFGPPASITVKDAGSKWTSTNDLRLSGSGNCTLSIEAGGEVSDSNGSVGYTGSSSIATVTGIGSKWTNNGIFNVGEMSGGTLNIEAGGQVSNAYGFRWQWHGL